MEWWMRYAYNTDNGKRAILGIINSPIKPNDRSPVMYSKPVHTKWIKAFDADISSGGCTVEFRRGDNGICN